MAPPVAIRLARSLRAAALASDSATLRSIDAFLTGMFGSGNPAGIWGGGFKAARIHRGNSDWPIRPRSVRQELEPALMALRARARDLSKNNPYAQSFLGLLDTNVIGPEGIRVKSRVRNASGDLDVRTNGLIDEAWNDWANSPVTLDRKLALRDALGLILEVWATDGELLVRHVHQAPNPYGYAIGTIDADMLDERYHVPADDGQNEIRMSVEIDKNGAEVAFWVREGVDAYSYPLGGTKVRLVAWDPFTRTGEILHPHLMHRISQTRGASWFHAVMEKMDNVEGYNESALYGAKQNAASTLLITPSDDTPEKTVDAEATPAEQIELAPASAFRLRPGDKAEFWEPKQQQLASMPQFLKEMGRQMAIALGPQYYALAHDLENTSFSSMRGGENLMKPLFRVVQSRMISRVLRPIREAWLKNAMLSGKLKLPGLDPTPYLAASYQGRGFPYVNPWEDARAYSLLIEAGLTSRTRVLAETTQAELLEIFDELELERKEADKRGISIVPTAAKGTTDTNANPDDSPSAGSPQDAPAAKGGSGSGTKGKDATVPAPVRARMNGKHAEASR